MNALVNATRKLIVLLQTSIDRSLANNQVHPSLLLYRRRKVLALEQTETGPQLRRSRTEYFQKPDWSRPSQAVFKKVEQSPEYNDFLAALARIPTARSDIPQDAKRALHRIIAGVFEGKTYTAESVASLLERDLTEESLPVESEIEIHGMALSPKSLEVKVGERSFLFRQIQQSDFEKEISQFELDCRVASSFEVPSVVLKIRMPGHVPLDLQKEAGRALILLRLFKAGAVQLGRQTFSAETLTNPFFTGTYGPGILSPSTDRLSLGPADAEWFQRYWTATLPILPKALNPYESEQPETFLKIAYDRYCDSLFHQGRTEGRLAFAVMALEALFLGRDEKADLKYRLAVRVAKLLSKLGFSGPEVRDRVREAYDIRSTYVHGGHLSPKDQARTEKRLGTKLEQLRLSILDYVRNVILVCVFGNIDKDNLLSLLDGSLLDATSEGQLDNLLVNYQTHLLAKNSPQPKAHPSSPASAAGSSPAGPRVCASSAASRR